MRLDDRLADAQAQSDAAFSSGLRAFRDEPREDLAQHIGCYAAIAVGDPKHRPAVPDLRRHDDARRRGGMLDGVVDEVDEHLPDELAVHGNEHHVVGRRHRDFMPFPVRHLVHHCVADDVVDDLRLEIKGDVLVLHARHAQQVVDHLGEPPRVGRHRRQQRLPLSFPHLAAVALQELGVALDARERRAQVMGHAPQQRGLEALPFDLQLVRTRMLLEVVALDRNDGLLDGGIQKRSLRLVKPALGAVDCHHAVHLGFRRKRDVEGCAAGGAARARAGLVSLLVAFKRRRVSSRPAERDRHLAPQDAAERVGGERAGALGGGAVDQAGADLVEAAQHQCVALSDLDLLLHTVGERAGDERDHGEDDQRHRVSPIEDQKREMGQREEQVVHQQVHDAEHDPPQPRVRLERGDEDPHDEQQEARLGLEPHQGEAERHGDPRDEQQRHDAEVAQDERTPLRCGNGVPGRSNGPRINVERHSAPPP